jgi:hypothetical protein
LAGAAVSAPAQAEPGPGAPIDATVSAALAAGTGDFWVVFGEHADLSAAAGIRDWAQRGAAVTATLRRTADRSQAGVRARLDRAKVGYQPYWVSNAVLVHNGSAELATNLAGEPGVARIAANTVHEPPKRLEGGDRLTVDAVEWGIAAIRADQVWSGYGLRGEGVVVANIDTGVKFDHPALVNAYRGNLGGGTFDHTYNWVNFLGTCGPVADLPCDDFGHGTHVMGTMAGDGGAGNQIGVAPGARWIAARACDVNGCFTDALMSAGQWMLAPTDRIGLNPRPDLRPHVINNSWGGRADDFFYRDMVNAWRAAGIFPAFSIGNSGPACDTAASPGDYRGSFASGAFDASGRIADFSSRGPGESGDVKPNLAAPGVDVRSALPNGGYILFSGTSMASPHTAGTVALIWSAAPSLVGDIAGTEAVLNQSATDTSDLSCGGTAADNHVWGEGKLDALGAVARSPLGTLGTLTGTVTNAATGAPLAGAQVRLTGAATRSVTTGTDGRYTLLVPVGGYQVAASLFGFGTVTGPATVTAGSTATRNAALPPSPTHAVSGQVRDGGGNPVANATVSFGGTPIPPVTTNATGGYSFAAVPAGGYQVTARPVEPCLAAATQPLTVDGTETLNLTLGPRADEHGYTCQVEGAGYVEGTTAVTLAGDDSTASVPLPFSFPFYGTSYPQAFLSTNGNLNFVGENPYPFLIPDNSPTPASRLPNAAIYPFWDNLLLDATSRVFTRTSGTAPNREFLVEWRNATFFGDTTQRVDFEVVLVENGQIVLRYRNIDPALARERGSSATVGIENRSGSIALQFSHNTASLSNAQSIRFRPPATPGSGEIRGTVTDAETGQPLLLAFVRAIQGGLVKAERNTPATGAYSLQLPLGSYTIAVSKAGHATHTANLTLTSGGQVLTHNVALTDPPP